MQEIWRPIAGQPFYQVSSFGRVRSLDRTIIRMTKRGPVLARLEGKVLQAINGGDGYAMVNLGAAERRYVHELVLTTFRGERPVGLQAAHNGDRRDNRSKPAICDSLRERGRQGPPRHTALRREGTQRTQDQLSPWPRLRLHPPRQAVLPDLPARAKTPVQQ